MKGTDRKQSPSGTDLWLRGPLGKKSRVTLYADVGIKEVRLGLDEVLVTSYPAKFFIFIEWEAETLGSGRVLNLGSRIPYHRVSHFSVEEHLKLIIPIRGLG